MRASRKLGENTALVACTLVALVGIGATAEADVVTLKNGDWITGTFVSVTGATLRFQADALGLLTIPVRQVATLTPAKTVVVFARGQPPLGGELTLEPSGDWQLNDNGVTYTISPASVTVILPADAYQSIVGHMASPWQDWTGTASLGYSIQRGNQESNTFSTTLDTKRERPQAPIFQSHWRTTVYLTALLSSALEAEKSITSNTLSTSVRQDILFAPGNFVFALVQFDHVGTQGLVLRQTYGGGTGYDFMRTGRGAFSVFGGLTFLREAFVTNGEQQTAQLLAGEKFHFQLTQRVQLDHTANAYPNLSILGQYHFDTNTALVAQLTSRFSLHTGVVDLYLTNPAPGSKRNNFALTAGIAATF